MSSFRGFAEKMHLSSDYLLGRRCFVQRGRSSWAMGCLLSRPVMRDSQWVQCGGRGRFLLFPLAMLTKDTTRENRDLGLLSGEVVSPQRGAHCVGSKSVCPRGCLALAAVCQGWAKATTASEVWERQQTEPVLK